MPRFLAQIKISGVILRTNKELLNLPSTIAMHRVILKIDAYGKASKICARLTETSSG